MFSEVKITTSPRGQWVNHMMFNPMYQSSGPSRGQLRFSSEVGTGHSATVSSIMLAPLGSSDQAVGALLLSFSGCLLALGSQLLWPHDSWRPRLSRRYYRRVLSLVPKGRTGWEDHMGQKSWACCLTRDCGSRRLRIQSHGSAGGSGLLSRFLRVCCHLCAKFLKIMV